MPIPELPIFESEGSNNIDSVSGFVDASTLNHTVNSIPSLEVDTKEQESIEGARFLSGFNIGSYFSIPTQEFDREEEESNGFLSCFNIGSYESETKHRSLPESTTSKCNRHYEESLKLYTVNVSTDHNGSETIYINQEEADQSN